MSGRPPRRSILVVDDEVVIAEAVRAVLEDEGYGVVTASNGREGLERLAERRPDLVLLDMMMPVMDGPSMRRAMLADRRWADVPVVVMSAVHASLREIDFDHVEFIAKPFDLDTLLSAVDRALLQLPQR